MKLQHYLAIAASILAATAAPGQRLSTAEWRLQQIHQWKTQQQLDAQNQEIQRLQDAQRRAKRDADYYCEPLPPVRVPAKYPLPMQPAAVPAASSAQQAQRDRFIRSVMADPKLSHEAKMRIVGPLLNAAK